MPQEETYYDILRVKPDAQMSEIKSQFRKLTMEFHPDRNSKPEAKGIFQKINEAYETLRDEGKRKRYNFSLSMGFGGGGGGGMDGGFPMSDFPFEEAEEILQGLFRGRGGGGGVGGGMPHVRVFTTHGMGGLEGLGGLGGLSGLSGLGSIAGMMGGLGGLAGGLANGLGGGGGGGGMPGKPMVILKNIHITLEQVYHGAYLPVEIDRWMAVEGTKQYEKETVYVKIPPGIDDNEMIVLSKKGNVINDHCIGDVKLVINVNNTTPFQRQGLDLYLEHTVSLQEALCGFQFDIHHVDGKTYTVNNQRGNIVAPEQKKTIAGKGLVRESERGALHIVFHVEFPMSLPEVTLTALEKVLGGGGDGVGDVDERRSASVV
jgi:DnaJ-class molecular chaperone